jgi:hypothetical protein
VKLSKADFAVRCGVNAGAVYFDDSTPLKTISDRVIDVAGHMQKNAEPNTVLVARKIIEPLHQLEEFTHPIQVIDGHEASVWSDKVNARLRPPTYIGAHRAARCGPRKKAAPNAALSCRRPTQ